MLANAFLLTSELCRPWSVTPTQNGPRESLICKGSPLRVCFSPTLKAPQINSCCHGERDLCRCCVLLFKSRRTFSHFNVLLWHVYNGYFMEFVSYSLSEHFELQVLEANWNEHFTSALADLCNTHYCLG